MKKLSYVILLSLGLMPQNANAWEYFTAFKEANQPARIRACSNNSDCTLFTLDDPRLDNLGKGTHGLPQFINLEAGTSNLHFFVNNTANNRNLWTLNLDDGSLTSVGQSDSKVTGADSEPHDYVNDTLSLSGRRSFVQRFSGQVVSLVTPDGKNIIKNIVQSTGDIIEIGSGASSTTISSEGVSIGGTNLIKRSEGVVSIGENSLKLREQGGRQQMWATDANGDSIDIDIVNGSRLLINGRDVEKSIDNVGALSAALGSVPAVSADSQFTCGFGAGTHSSAYALSGGCASRVSDRVSVNAALATVINNHTGDSDDNLSARAGFTFRLGKIDYSPKVAARKSAELHDKVAKLEERNESLLALLQSQASRLERLEKIASGQLSLMGDRASSD